VAKVGGGVCLEPRVRRLFVRTARSGRASICEGEEVSGSEIRGFPRQINDKIPTSSTQKLWDEVDDSEAIRLEMRDSTRQV
jgi:hypothetical protein